MFNNNENILSCRVYTADAKVSDVTILKGVMEESERKCSVVCQNVWHIINDTIIMRIQQ